MARKPNQQKRKKPFDVLYRAVGTYVRKLGGHVTIAGPVYVQKWPDDGPGHFSIAVRCFGRQPKYADYGGVEAIEPDATTKSAGAPGPKPGQRKQSSAAPEKQRE